MPIVDRATAPDGTEIVLTERAGDFSMRAGGRELVSSRAHGSEEALGERVCAALIGRDAPRLLICGLGMAYTLRAALAALPRRARVCVVELIPEVVEWNRGPLRAPGPDPLEDPRVRVVVADAFDRLVRERDLDAVLLDVDNGPRSPSHAANRRLYSSGGIARAVAALRPGGILAIWCPSPEPELGRRLEEAGLEVGLHDVGARSAADRVRHAILLGRRRRPFGSPSSRGGAPPRDRRFETH